MQSIMQSPCCSFYTKSILFYVPSPCSTFDTAKIFVLNMYNCIEDIKEELEGLTASLKSCDFWHPLMYLEPGGINFAQLILQKWLAAQMSVSISWFISPLRSMG